MRHLLTREREPCERRLRAHALMALGRTKEPVSNPEFERAWQDPWLCLAASLGLRLEGHEAESAGWLKRTRSTLDAMGKLPRTLSDVLGSAGPVPPSRLDEITFLMDEKALVLAILARRFPGRRYEYLAEARKFNLSHNAPYLMVKLATERPEPPKP